jgi:hypothetical protein
MYAVPQPGSLAVARTKRRRVSADGDVDETGDARDDHDNGGGEGGLCDESMPEESESDSDASASISTLAFTTNSTGTAVTCDQSPASDTSPPLHPLLQVGEEEWKRLSVVERRQRMVIHRKAIKATRDRLAKRRFKLEVRTCPYNWDLKPHSRAQLRAMVAAQGCDDTTAAPADADADADAGSSSAASVAVAGLPAEGFRQTAARLLLAPGDVLASTQVLDLRIAELANLVNKVPRFSKWEGGSSSSVTGEADNLACHKSLKSVCARSYVPNDTFVVRATRVAAGWKIQEATPGSPLVAVTTTHPSVDSKCAATKSVRCCAFSAKQLAPIVRDEMVNNPRFGHKDTLQLLAQYVTDCSAISPSFTHAVRCKAKTLLTGNAVKGNGREVCDGLGELLAIDSNDL